MLEDISQADFQKNVKTWKSIISKAKVDKKSTPLVKKKVRFEEASSIKTSLDVANTLGSLCDQQNNNMKATPDVYRYFNAATLDMIYDSLIQKEHSGSCNINLYNEAVSSSFYKINSGDNFKTAF